MLHDERFPARRHLIAHCVREIANSLPFFFDGAVVGHVEYRTLIQPIVKPWAEAGLPIGTEAAPVMVGAGEAIGDGSAITVPGPIVRQIGKMLEAHTAVSGRRRQNAPSMSFPPIRGGLKIAHVISASHTSRRRKSV